MVAAVYASFPVYPRPIRTADRNSPSSSFLFPSRSRLFARSIAARPTIRLEIFLSSLFLSLFLSFSIHLVLRNSRPVFRSNDCAAHFARPLKIIKLSKRKHKRCTYLRNVVAAIVCTYIVRVVRQSYTCTIIEDPSEEIAACTPYTRTRISSSFSFPRTSR